MTAHGTLAWVAPRRVAMQFAQPTIVDATVVLVRWNAQYRFAIGSMEVYGNRRWRYRSTFRTYNGYAKAFREESEKYE